MLLHFPKPFAYPWPALNRLDYFHINIIFVAYKLGAGYPALDVAS